MRPSTPGWRQNNLAGAAADDERTPPEQDIVGIAGFKYADVALRDAIERILAPLGRRVDELSPMVDGRLADGSGPALPGASRIRLPSASPPCCDRTEAKVSHLHSNRQRLTAHVDRGLAPRRPWRPIGR